jgi:hypothetical protein
MQHDLVDELRLMIYPVVLAQRLRAQLAVRRYSGQSNRESSVGGFRAHPAGRASRRLKHERSRAGSAASSVAIVE